MRDDWVELDFIWIQEYLKEFENLSDSQCVCKKVEDYLFFSPRIKPIEKLKISLYVCLLTLPLLST